MLGFSSMPSRATPCSASALNTACSTEPVTSSQRSMDGSRSSALPVRRSAPAPVPGTARHIARGHAHLRRCRRGSASPSPMRITARHFANRAPRSRYSARRSRRPSSPSVTVSPGEPASGFAPVSTLIPGRMPAPKAFGQGLPGRALLADGFILQDDAADELGRAGAVNSISR